MFKNKILVTTVLLLLTACAHQPSNVATKQKSYSLRVVQAIPKPSDMVADVIVNGRVSTIKHIDVAYVGKQIPFTYSDGKVFNSAGFEWFVSKHFALRTDYPAEKAQFFLELLELSYPHYVEYFGMEPVNINHQRIASTYATSNKILRGAMFDDGFNRGIHHTAGGEAMYYNLVGYSFPTERPQHRRYISIHETMHSYQMALGNYPWTPSWHGEGQGDSLANHVFDSEKKRLSLYGSDSPIFDVTTSGYFKYLEERPTIVDIHNRKNFHRGLNVLFVQFMHNSPEYSQFLKMYHQEVIKRQTGKKEESLEILKSVVPDWARLEKDFKYWAENFKESHEVAARGPWEIDGNMFYKRPSSYDYKPQRLGLRFKPADKPVYRNLLLDFPAPDDSDLLLPIKRGVKAPTIGYELKYLVDSISQGSIGMALAVNTSEANAKAKAKSYTTWEGVNTDLDEQLRIEIKSAITLLIDERTLGGELKEIALPDSIVSALKAQKTPKLGVSIQLKEQALHINIKTDGEKAFQVNHPVSAIRFEQLLNREIGLVSTNNHHGITPYIDDGRDLNPNLPDYNQQTAANAWGFKGDGLSLRFARAIWRAGKNTPQIWKDTFSKLNRAALNPKTADAEVAAIEASMSDLAKAGANLNGGLAELSGVQLQLDWLGSSGEKLKEYAIITNRSRMAILGDISFIVAGQASQKLKVDVQAGQRQEILIPEKLLTQGDKVEARLSYRWHGFDITQIDFQKTKKYPGLTLTLPEAEYKDGKLVIDANLQGPFNGDTKGFVVFDLHHGSHKETQQEKVVINPYESKQYTHSFKIKEKDLEHSAWIEVTFVLESDGEPITLRQRKPYVPAKYNR